MYSEAVTERTLRAFAQKNGWMPEPHTPVEAEEFCKYIDSITDARRNKAGASFWWADGKVPSKNEVKFIRRWIDNEQYLCFASAEYFITRYAKIRNAEERILPFEFRLGQKILLHFLAICDDKQIAIQLFVLKCMDPKTKVLTADLRWIPLDDVKDGQQLVAVDEYAPKGKGNDRKMRTCTVEKKWETREKAVRLTMDDGREVVCGPEHPLLGCLRGGTTTQWRNAEDFRIGDRVRWITKPWEEPTHEDGWFAGLADGEGSCNSARKGADFCITQRLGETFNRARRYLRERDYNFGEELDIRTPEDSSVLGTQPVGRLRLSRMDELFRLFGRGRPSRFIGKNWWEGKSLPGKRSGVGWAKVVKIELLPEQRMVDIQTSTGTFIAEGFVTHNCRQVGISTAVAQFFLHRILFRTNTYAVMASVQAQQSDKLAAMIDTTWTRLPFWLGPPKTIIKAKEPRWSNGSKLSVQSGNQEVGIAQGDSPSCIHISELGDYANPKRVLEEGLFPACHATRSLFMVLEGTGSMATTWQREKWEYYTENLDKGGRFTPFFIPPSCAEDLYPPKDWLRARPVPEGWAPSEATSRMRRRAELFVRQTSYLSDVLGQHWQMGRVFQWYWECLWKEAVASHSESQFLSQYAPTPEDAFQSEHDPVFERDTIEVVTAGRERGYKPYSITGRTILIGSDNTPHRPNEEEVDWTEQRINLEWDAPDGNHYEWTLVPMKSFDDSDDAATFDKLMIYEPPIPGVQYAISVDTAYGLNTPNEDRAALSVCRDGGATAPTVQVASFTSLKVNSPQMARIAACVAVLFGQNENGGNDPKFVIEQVRKPGDECQHQLKIMGFTYHHIMQFYDQKGNIDPNKGSKEGWRTTAWSRSILLERFVDAVNTGWYILNDPIVIRQLGTFVRKKKDGGQTRMEHEEGQKDDNVFACAMGWTTLRDFENTALRLQSRYPLTKKMQEVVDEWATREVVLD